MRKLKSDLIIAMWCNGNGCFSNIADEGIGQDPMAKNWKKKINLEIRHGSLEVRVIKPHNSLSGEVVDHHNLESLKGY